MTHRFKLILLLIATALASARAAEPAGRSGIKLSDAISTALRSNPELHVFEAQIAGAKGGVTTARTWENPEVYFAPDFQVTREGGRRETVFHSDFDVNQTFKFPGKRALEVAIAQRNVELQQLALDGFRFQLSAKVRKAFYQMLAAQQIIGLRTEQVESAKVFVAVGEEACGERLRFGFRDAQVQSRVETTSTTYLPCDIPHGQRGVFPQSRYTARLVALPDAGSTVKVVFHGVQRAKCEFANKS
ncbi:MAG: TolC family protein [Chthoniobacter sp.]